MGDKVDLYGFQFLKGLIQTWSRSRIIKGKCFRISIPQRSDSNPHPSCSSCHRRDISIPQRSDSNILTLPGGYIRLIISIPQRSDSNTCMSISALTWVYQFQFLKGLIQTFTSVNINSMFPVFQFLKGLIQTIKGGFSRQIFSLCISIPQRSDSNI